MLRLKRDYLYMCMVMYTNGCNRHARAVCVASRAIFYDCLVSRVLIATNLLPCRSAFCHVSSHLNAIFSGG